ncbi:MAG TPA: hypothetical protein VGH14_15105 [Solirubrobacterales bacterium]|jgi:hypothetical protein
MGSLISRHRLQRRFVAFAAVLTVAALVPTGAGAAERPPLFSSQCANGTYKPTRFLIACGDASIRFKVQNWAQWDPSEALAEGLLTYPNCAPSVPLFKCDKQGRDLATVRLYRPRLCPKQGRRYFTRLLMFDSEAKVKSMERIKLRFNCSDVR